MPTALSEGETQCVIRLEGEIDIASAEELKGIMITAISSGKEIHVDLESTTDLDVTVVQLLWSTSREAEKSARSFSLVHIPDSVRSALRDMGIEDIPAAVSPTKMADPLLTPAKSADDR